MEQSQFQIILFSSIERDIIESFYCKRLEDRKKNLLSKGINMGGRKRKKVVKRIRKSIPKIFSCPSCGEKTLGISIDRNSGKATIKCGRCNIEDTVQVSRVEEAVDAYGRFVDKYYGSNKTVNSDEEGRDLPELKDN